NRTQPSMSGSAAGDVLLVVSTRDVSCGVFMAASPPLGSIQWNLRFMAVSIGLLFSSLAKSKLERLGQAGKPRPRNHTKQHETKRGHFVCSASCCFVWFRGSSLPCVPIPCVSI